MCRDKLTTSLLWPVSDRASLPLQEFQMWRAMAARRWLKPTGSGGGSRFQPTARPAATGLQPVFTPYGLAVGFQPTAGLTFGIAGEEQLEQVYQLDDGRE